MKKKVLFSGILLAFQVLLGHAQQRLLGGDISLLPSYEAAGTVYRNAVGEPVAPLDFFKEQGWNAVRVRLFVTFPFFGLYLINVHILEVIHIQVCIFNKIARIWIT